MCDPLKTFSLTAISLALLMTVACNPKDGNSSTQDAGPATLSKKWRVHILEYVQVFDIEEAERGVIDGLRKSGLKEGADFEVKVSNAHGDMPTLNGLVDNALSSQADLLVAISTPTIQTAMRRTKTVPIVFTYCANAVAAGVGANYSNHTANVTGVETAGAYRELLEAARLCLPHVKRVGTIFVPAEVNTVFHKDQLIIEGRKLGIEVIALAAATTTEVSDAALALTSKNLDAICQVGGNVTASSFPAIAKAAKTSRIPLFASLSSQADQGAALAVARDYYEAGLETGAMAARIMRGEDPNKIPIEIFAKNKIVVNKAAAAAFGLTIPKSLLDKAQFVQ